MSPLLIISLSLLAGLILFIIGYFWQKHAHSHYSRKHFHKIIHSILDEALLAHEIFEIEPDAPEVGYRSYRGQLETLTKDKLTFRMLDPIAQSLTRTPAYLLFRAKDQAGQQYFKFCCEIHKVIPEEPFQAVEMSFPINMEIGHKRAFSRVTPPQDRIRLLSLWTITPQQPMPLTLEQVGPPVLAAKRGAASPPIFLADISASGMAIGFPLENKDTPPPVDLERGSPLFCLLIFEMDGEPVTFWATCSVNNTRLRENPPAFLMGLEFTNWALLQPGERSLKWFHVSPLKGVDPILRWIESLSSKHHR